MTQLITTLGKLSADQLGMILPHEHIFVDLGPIEEENWKHADPDAVVELMCPELERARDVGVTALVDCTPMGVGRRAGYCKSRFCCRKFPYGSTNRDLSRTMGAPMGTMKLPWRRSETG